MNIYEMLPRGGGLILKFLGVFANFVLELVAEIIYPDRNYLGIFTVGILPQSSTRNDSFHHLFNSLFTFILPFDTTR